MLLCEHGITT